ncbi:MAG: HAD-IIIA family hydrolase [Methylocystis sp.]|jgi:histidinol-phosphate phosphatase family protein|nr:HAD-IIIA family hydrolase [Methylocystis sp.]MCA3583988.1 HAD-IIIA family hydrolase [Methylocystis sp.]MCA3588909.1 HAD-IIIA family hydrolase [Methylocystis sp.]MCA3592517.1 HAD-IIIA family hydrolase [Methylocystis sp.]
MSVRQAVILAGGKGTRLQERLNGRPKPLVDINGTPLLGRQLEILRQYGFTDVVILVNHAADQIADFCADAAFADLHVTLINDGEPRGSAGALLAAFERLAERFLVVYGDTLFDIDLDRFWQSHIANQAAGTLFLHPNDHPFDSDLVEVDDDKRVVRFHAAPHPSDSCLPNLVNAALYVLERDEIAFWRSIPAPTDIARDLFPAMLRKEADLRGYISFEYIKDIGTPKRLDKAVACLRSGVVARAKLDVKQKAVFLDRDGTINQLYGHLALSQHMRLLNGAAKAVKWLNENEYRTVVVTNQPVLARGETSFAEMRRIHGRMETLLGENGAFLDAIYFCPHHPDAGFADEVPELKCTCSCRKPAIGMIERAQSDLNIDLGQSWLVGDTTSDMLAAQRAGLLSILVETGEAGRDGRYDVRPDFVAQDLLDATRIVGEVYPSLLERASAVSEEVKLGTIVLIGGVANVGKSSFASVLRRLLQNRGHEARIVSLDEQFDARSTEIEAESDTLADALASPTDVTLLVEGKTALLRSPRTLRPILRLFIDADETLRKERLTTRSKSHDADGCEAEKSAGLHSLDNVPAIGVTRDIADIVITI